MAVHRQRQLREAGPGLLQRGLCVVERAAAGLHLRLFGFERDRRRLLAARFVGEPRGERARLLLQIEEPAAEEHALHRDHLVAQHAVAPGLAGLALQALELLFHLVDDVVHAEQVLLGGLELERGLPAPGLVLGDAGRLLDECAAVGGLARKDHSDLALLDDRVGLGAEAGVHEQLVDVAQAAHLAVHEVLALAVAVQAAGHHALGSTVGAVAVEARDLQVDLGHRQRLARLAAREDHVLHRGAAQALHALLAEDPGDGVGDVALAAAVGAHDAGDPALEGEFLLVAEGLEADDLDSLEAHGG